MTRVHSETDTNSLVKHPRDIELSQTHEPPATDDSNHTQFSMGSSNLLNGSKTSKTDTLTDKRNKVSESQVVHCLYLCGREEEEVVREVGSHTGREGKRGKEREGERRERERGGGKEGGGEC